MSLTIPARLYSEVIVQAVAARDLHETLLVS